VALPFGSVGRIPTELHAVPVFARMRYETRDSDDVDQHAGHLSSWRQQYDQISRGRFEGRVRELWLDEPGLQVFHEYTGQQTNQQCEPWAGAIWFGVPDGRCTSDVHFCGRRQDWGAGRPVLRACADAGFALHTPRDFGIYGVTVDEAWLRLQLERLHLPVPKAQVQARGVSPAVHLAICETIEAVLRLSAAGDAEQPWGRMALQAMIEHLLRLLSSEEDASTMIEFDLSRRRWAIVMTARELVSHPMNHAMTVDDLCAQLHVTRRTLQNHFQRVVGESPADFLKAVRLNACRRRLRESEAAMVAIQEVAAQWGFFHMGHFSADYKAMFGELPSQTLRTPPARRPSGRTPAPPPIGLRRPVEGRWVMAGA